MRDGNLTSCYDTETANTARDLPMRDGNSERRITPPSVSKARDLPMRDGNCPGNWCYAPEINARDLPMRDGNRSVHAVEECERRSPRSSYEGWKPFTAACNEGDIVGPRSSYEGWKLEVRNLFDPHAMVARDLPMRDGNWPRQR